MLMESDGDRLGRYTRRFLRHRVIVHPAPELVDLADQLIRPES
jgi:hypothetical protein